MSRPDGDGTSDDGSGRVGSLPNGEDDAQDDQRARRRNRAVLVVALVLLALPLLGVVGYVGWLNHVVTSNVTREPLMPAETSAPSGDQAVAGEAPPPARGGENYLLIGSDAGPGREGARSDVMIIVHVPADHATVELVHFPRDLWVPIPGHGEAKLNAAYAWGGAPLLVTTMQDMLNVRIDHVAVIGFDGFRRMTDAVGGVDVTVEEPSVSDGYTFQAGTMHMTGDMALAFVRERKQLSEGDVSRGRRQQAFLKALMVKTLQPETLLNPARLTSFVDAASSNLTVDQSLDVGTVRSEALALRGVKPAGIRFVTAPFSGFGTSADGQSIDLVDAGAMKRLGDALRNDTMSSYH